jgi:hypothetical protein
MESHEEMGKEMNIEIITSFNQRYYDLIGHESLATFLQHWPNELKITCYVEGMTLPQQARVQQVGFDQLPKEYWDLQQAEVKDRVKTFGKKAWSVIHAMYNTSADWVVWLDSDVITTKSVTQEILKTVLPSNVLATYMGVTYLTTKTGELGNWLVPETGVFAINCKHPKFDAFRTEYRRRYVDMDRSELRRFYDNDVFGAAVRSVTANYNDLCKDFTKPYKTPLRHTVLGPYLHHYKAKHSKDNFAQLTDDQ